MTPTITFMMMRVIFEQIESMAARDFLFIDGSPGCIIS
jgi:hypothetical protein